MLSLLLLVPGICVWADHKPYQPAPHIDPNQDAMYIANAQQTPILFWPRPTQVAGYRNIEKISPTRKINAGSSASSLPQNLSDLSGVGVGDMTVADYVKHKAVAGLLVIKDGEIAYEYYGLGNDQDSRWISFSVAKSVVSMLFGAAIQDGYIASVDEKVTDYLPRLKNSPYSDVTIRNLLQMASGVAWNEDYADPSSDVASATWDTLSLYEFLNNKPRVAKAGDKFNYNTAETNLAGTLLRAAIGNNLSTYLSDKIWQPSGMQADAFWQLTEPGGGEFGGCCISATLRDYARLGLFALNNGQLPDGTQVFPGQWMRESVAPSKGSAGYGYFWWLQENGGYAASGIFGQGIYVNPETRVVIALHSARQHASQPSDWVLQNALYEALDKALATSR